jgi:hypothetical protein
MSYLLGDPVSGQAVAIDPRPDPVRSYADCLAG